MKVYVFGNEDVELDSQAVLVVRKLSGDFPATRFVQVKPNENLPFDSGEDAIIMDVVEGLSAVKMIDNDELDRVVLPPRTTAHDFDLGFQLKYLKKLGKLGKVTLVGLPMSGDLDYNLIHSIFKKLVAQDIQGS